ncbi:hypothetical protein [Paenibacillus silvisoli]|uniref:hypothetical protein n=1 Tax=Paenibacillus silvisoli TaxID=3110539 RepID=UPI002804CD54|nr:hypothetical protein [Paenibacillus silvisoli]
MNAALLQWGLVSFMIGIFLSLPLAAVYYDQSPPWAKVFANPRKLKSAHLDFFTQAFAAGFVYLLENRAGSPLPAWVIIPLLYGTIGNPLILLLEATVLIRRGGMAVFYRIMKATSPASLLFAWLVIAATFLKTGPLIFLGAFVLTGAFIVWRQRGK